MTLATPLFTCHCGADVYEEIEPTFQFINGEWVWVKECAECAKEEEL